MYIGTIDERSDENNDVHVHVKFMTRSKRTGTCTLSWPPDDPSNECYMCHFRTCSISTPEIQTTGDLLQSHHTHVHVALLPTFK